MTNIIPSLGTLSSSLLLLVLSIPELEDVMTIHIVVYTYIYIHTSLVANIGQSVAFAMTTMI